MIPAFLIRKSVIGNIRFPEEIRYGEDIFFWLQIAARNVRFRLIPYALVHIRKHAGNISRKSQRVDGMIEWHQQLLDSGLLQKRHHTFITYARLFLKFLEKRSLGCFKYLALMLAYPDLFIKYSWMYWLTWPRRSQD